MSTRGVFYDVLAEAAEGIANSVSDVLPAHKFSMRYKQKKKALIKAYEQKKEHGTDIQVTFRRSRLWQQIRIAVLVVLSVLLLTGAALYVTYYIGGMKAEMYSDHSDVFSFDDENAPEFIEDDYRITYNLDGYNHNILSDDKILYWETFENDTEKISFSVSPKSTYKNARFNTEYSGLQKKVFNGIEMMYFVTAKGMHCLTWDNGDYIFEFDFTVSFEEVEEFIKSIQKVE